MANISEEKWIEMLEKKADGSYIAKYPKVKSKSGITFDEHLAENETQAHLARNISFVDGSNVEEHQSLIASRYELGHVSTGLTGSNLTLQNGWSGVLECMRDDMGNTYLILTMGDIRAGTTTRNTVIATIPEGYRPPASSYTFNILVLGQNGVAGVLRFGKDGKIKVESPSFTSSIGLSFGVIFRNKY